MGNAASDPEQSAAIHDNENYMAEVCPDEGLERKNAINGAQLRGQSVVDSQPAGLSPAASNSQSVRTRNSGLGAESAVGSSDSLYYSSDLDPEEDERRDSTPYRICREDVRRRHSRRPSPHTQYYTPISPAESDDEFYEHYTVPESGRLYQRAGCWSHLRETRSSFHRTEE